MLLTFSHLILTIARIISYRQVKDILLVLIETLVHQRKSLGSILVKQRQSFVCVCITRVIIVICWLKDKKVCKFKANDKFPNQCSLRTISNKCRGRRSISLKGNVYDLLVDYDTADESDIWNFLRYSMVENVSGLLRKNFLCYWVLVDL